MKIDLFQGDCIEIMKTIKDGSIDLILTDPPYGTTNQKWDTVIPFHIMWEQLNRIIKPNGAILLFGMEPFSSELRCSNKSNFKYDWIWQKTTATGHLNAKRQPLNDYEIISVFYKKQCNYYPIKTTGHPRKISSAKHKRNSKITELYNHHQLTDYDSTERYPKRILNFSTEKQKNKLHPNQKPVPLLKYFIETYTLEGEVVLDFTMGSGSTGEACQETNRNFIGIEIGDKEFQIATNRLKNTHYGYNM